jgi:hypothetical protein
MSTQLERIVHFGRLYSLSCTILVHDLYMHYRIVRVS